MESEILQNALIEPKLVAVDNPLILVFSTNLALESDLREVGRIMREIPAISSWSVDLEDCDRVLRVVAERHITSLVILHFRENGIQVSELPD